MSAGTLYPPPAMENMSTTSPSTILEGQKMNDVVEKERIKILVGDNSSETKTITPPNNPEKGKMVVETTNLKAMAEASQKEEVSKMAMNFFKSQNDAIENMRKQQEDFLKSLLENNLPPRPKRRHPEDEESDMNIVPPPKYRRTEGYMDQGGETSQIPPENLTGYSHDDAISLCDPYQDEFNLEGAHVDTSHDSYQGGTGEEEDALSKDSSLSAEDHENFMIGKHKIMLEQVEEKLGEPISKHLEKAFKKTWNTAVLNHKKKEEMLNGILIPSNMKCMKTPKLNSEIFIRMGNVGRDKDEASANRQRELTRATIPLLRAMEKTFEVQMSFLERAKRDQVKHPLTPFEKTSYKKLQEAYEEGQRAYNTMNYFLTDNTRRRKYSALISLGKDFTSMSTVKEEEIDADNRDDKEYLFGEEVINKMSSQLKKLPIKPTVSKNAQNSGRPQRSFNSGNVRGRYQQQQQHQHRQQNFNHNNNQNYGNNGQGNRRHQGQYRPRGQQRGGQRRGR